MAVTVNVVNCLNYFLEHGVTSIGSKDISDFLGKYKQLQEGNLDKEDIPWMFIKGLTSGEILEHPQHYNTRQGLYSKLSRVYGKDYKAQNVKNRKALSSLCIYYFWKEAIDEGALDIDEILEKYVTGTKKRFIKYYIAQGGERDIWEKGSTSKSKYDKFFPFMNQLKSIEKVIDELKEKDNLSELEQELLGLTHEELQSLKAGYGRIKKKQIHEAIISGMSKEDVINNFNITSYQYGVHYQNVAKKYQQVWKQVKGRTNTLQWLKYKLKVVGNITTSITPMKDVAKTD